MSLSSRDSGSKVVRNVSFQVRDGEILGIAGLMGAGRTELLLGIFGAFKGKIEGEVYIDGEPAVIRSPADAIASGISLVPEDRRLNGLVMNFSVGKNITLASLSNVSRFGVLNENMEVRLQEKMGELLVIKTPSFDTAIGNLSGGNQQKVVIGRWLARGEPRVLFLDEPTNGIDVGAKFEMYGIMNDLAKKGSAIVLVSSELPSSLAYATESLSCARGKSQGSSLVRRRAKRKSCTRRRSEDDQTRGDSTVSQSAQLEPVKGIPPLPRARALRNYAMIFALLGIWIIFEILSKGVFLSARNIAQLARQTAITGVLSIGAVMLIISGNFDISIGSVLGLTGGIAAILQAWFAWPTPLAILGAIVLGVLIGAWQGFWVAYKKVPSFIVTLGGLMIFRGVLLVLTQGKTIAPLRESFTDLGGGFLPKPIGYGASRASP